MTSGLPEGPVPHGAVDPSNPMKTTLKTRPTISLLYHHLNLFVGSAQQKAVPTLPSPILILPCFAETCFSSR